MIHEDAPTTKPRIRLALIIETTKSTEFREMREWLCQNEPYTFNLEIVILYHFDFVRLSTARLPMALP